MILQLLLALTLNSSCGVERGAVKYLTDPGAAKIVWTPRIATIAQLRAIPALKGKPTTRTKPEFQVYTLKRVLIKLVKVEADEDYHTVLADAQGNTMIVEIPSVNCEHNAHLKSLAADRKTVLTHVGRYADVTGVLFLDFKHGQTGVAPNAVELHPVVSVKIVK